MTSPVQVHEPSVSVQPPSDESNAWTGVDTRAKMSRLKCSRCRKSVFTIRLHRWVTADIAITRHIFESCPPGGGRRGALRGHFAQAKSNAMGVRESLPPFQQAPSHELGSRAGRRMGEGSGCSGWHRLAKRRCPVAAFSSRRPGCSLPRDDLLPISWRAFEPLIASAECVWTGSDQRARFRSTSNPACFMERASSRCHKAASSMGKPTTSFHGSVLATLPDNRKQMRARPRAPSK